MLIQEPLRVDVHRTKLPTEEMLARGAQAPVPIKCRTWRIELYQDGDGEHQRADKHSANHRPQQVQGTFEPSGPGIQKVLLDLKSQGSREISGRHRRVCYAIQVGYDQNVAEAFARHTHHAGKLLAAGVGDGEDEGVYSQLAPQIRRVSQGLFAGNLPVGLSCSHQVVIEEANRGVSHAPLLLEELPKSCSGLFVTKY